MSIAGGALLRATRRSVVRPTDVTLTARAAFALSALAFTFVTWYLYVEVFGTAGVFDYMGIRVLPVSASRMTFFMGIALLPVLWLPVHVRRPSDVIQLFLYYAVHVPTAVLMPLVSYSSPVRQVEFCVAISLGLLALDLRYALPDFKPPDIRVSTGTYWSALCAFYLLAITVFASSGYLSFSRIEFFQVYDQREELSSRAATLGPLFFYIANWTGAAFAPFLVVAGLHLRRWLVVLLAIALATASFVVSSNKANYIAVPAVIGGYYALHAMRGRWIAVLMALAFVTLAGAARLVDEQLGSALGGLNAPVVTYQVFHRIFTNNGFLSAIYLDLFARADYAYYADSFLRWVPGPRLAAPVPALAGASFTDVPGVWANANLWADGYANLGWLGIAFMSLLTGFLLWIYDGIARSKDFIVTTAALIVPASVLANTATHVALISNGMFLVFLLVYAWPDAPRATPAKP